MRAVIYRGIDTLNVETVPVPRIGTNELLVKVAACGVCPTDIKKIQHGTVPPPRIFGHETSGTIVRVGSRLKNFRVGDRVALHHHVPCRKCHFCRHRAFAQCQTYRRTGITAGFEPAGGGYAEYVRVMSFVLPGVVKIPTRNSFVEGAMLEPVNTVLKAVNRLDLLRGDSVWVVGQGPIGLMFTRILKLRGIRVLASDLFASRLRLAKKMGTHAALRPVDITPAVLEKLTRGRGMDAAIIAVPSSEAMSAARTAVRGGGKVLLFAHTRRGEETPLDLSSICVDEKDLIGSYSSDITLQNEAARLVFSRQLDVRKIITDRFPLEQTAQAIHLAANPGEKSLKIMVVQPL